VEREGPDSPLRFLFFWSPGGAIEVQSPRRGSEKITEKDWRINFISAGFRLRPSGFGGQVRPWLENKSALRAYGNPSIL